MIPKRDGRCELDEELEILIDKQQSYKPKNKANPGIKYKMVGKCLACKRENVALVLVKTPLCSRCVCWVKGWIAREYGHYESKYIVEALIAFNTKVHCRFYHLCGNEVHRLKNDKVISERSIICDKCLPIFKAGVMRGINKVKKRRV